MVNLTDETADPAFIAYLRGLAKLGHDPQWLHRNTPSLRLRFERDPVPFEPLPDPVRVRDRYEEI
jgi:hypothetical protein